MSVLAASGLFSGAALGAGIGFSKDNPWGALIGASIGGALGLFQGASKQKDVYEAQKAQYKAIAEFNKKNQMMLLEQVNQLNLQRMLDNTRTSAALFNINAQERQASSELTHSLAVRDVVGASASDAASTLAIKTQRAVGSAVQQAELQSEGRLLMLNKMTKETEYSFQNASDVYSQYAPLEGRAIGSALGNVLGAGLSIGSKVFAPRTSTEGSAPLGKNTYTPYSAANYTSKYDLGVKSYKSHLF
jgi:hypothetical protein